IIMEYVDGNTLDNLIEINSEAFNSSLWKDVFAQVLSAFEYAHINNIIHRDIKPSNIMVSHENKVKILDFGIAKLLSSNPNLTKTGTKMGSIYYMSPEQVMGYDVDLRSDIYSLGVVLYEMLTGRQPFNSQTESEYEIMDSIIKKPLPDARIFN